MGVLLLGVVEHALKIDYNRRFVPDHPSVMARRQHVHITWAKIELGAVSHHDVDALAAGVHRRAALADLGSSPRYLEPKPSMMVFRLSSSPF